MMISTKGRYALRVMIDLAQHPGEEYIPLCTIAARQEISEKYLEAILKVLVKEKLLTGLRGKGGGYRLGRDAGEITAWDIISITEPGLSPVACLGQNAKSCDREDMCSTLPMWRDFNRTLEEFFKGYTLKMLAGPYTVHEDI